MNTKHLSSTISTDGQIRPLYYIDSGSPKDYVIEALAGIGGLVALLLVVIVVFAL